MSGWGIFSQKDISGKTQLARNEGGLKFWMRWRMLIIDLNKLIVIKSWLPSEKPRINFILGVITSKKKTKLDLNVLRDS